MALQITYVLTCDKCNEELNYEVFSLAKKEFAHPMPDWRRGYQFMDKRVCLPCFKLLAKEYTPPC